MKIEGLNTYEILICRSDNKSGPYKPYGIMIVNTADKNSARKLAHFQVGNFLSNNYYYTMMPYNEGLITGNLDVHNVHKMGVVYWAEFPDIFNGTDGSLRVTCDNYQDCLICEELPLGMDY